jgi:hypothetical protein
LAWLALPTLAAACAIARVSRPHLRGECNVAAAAAMSHRRDPGHNTPFHMANPDSLFVRSPVHVVGCLVAVTSPEKLSAAILKIAVPSEFHHCAVLWILV